MMFGGNIDEQFRSMACAEMGMVEVEKHSKYLGLPVVVGQNKRAIFREVEEKVEKKLQSWKHKLISASGRYILIKSVIQAMPTFTMQCYRLPRSINANLLKVAVNFFWGGKAKGKGIHWLNKNILCRDKSKEGIGLKDTNDFNDALLMKQLWRFEADPDLLVSQIFKGKYFPESTLSEARLGSNPSHVWRNLYKLCTILKTGIRKEGEGPRPAWRFSAFIEYTTKSEFELIT